MKNILCVKWGDKYTSEHVEKLKQQVEKHCSYDFNFYCLTDKPEKDYDIQLPTWMDEHYIPEKNFFWAYRKCYMFDQTKIFGDDSANDEFLFFDIDVLIHNSIDPLWELPMDKPYIVRGWWNDIKNCQKNYGKLKSTPLNSSVIRWNGLQLHRVYNHIRKNAAMVFFTYRTIDNYFNHFFYNIHNEEESFFRGYPKGMIYSWYKGNIFDEDMELKKLRKDHMICLFNNSASGIDEDMNDISEINELY